MSKPNNFVTLQMLQTVIKNLKDTCAQKADIKFHISADNISPASLFGGTWEKIEGKFLLAAGGGYPLGGVGGEATHTLTIAEMPSHKHSVLFYNEYAANGTISFNAGGKLESYVGASDTSIDSKGGGAAHNNMPPYIAVNIWKRVA